MSREKWMRAVGEIDEELVAEFLEQDIKKKPSPVLRRAKRLWWVPIPAVAACLCVAIGSYYLAPLLMMDPFEDPNTDPVKPPISEELRPWAPVIGEDVPVVEVTAEVTDRPSYIMFFDSIHIYGLPDNWYSIKTVPNGENLVISPIPIEPYLPIYEQQEMDVDKAKLDAFIQRWLPAAGELTGIADQAYEIKYGGKSGLPSPSIYYATIGSRDTKQYIDFRGIEDSSISFTCPAEAIVGQQYFPSVLFSDSDESILVALEDGIAYLKDTLGLEFQDAQVDRSKSGDVVEVDDTLYSISYMIATDDMTVTLQGHLPKGSDAFPTEIASVPAYTVTLRYRYLDRENSDQLVFDRLTYSEPMNSADHFSLIGQAKTITLAKAEELLEAGYVYSATKCLLCREQKIDVDFSDYDTVGSVYCQGTVGKYFWSVPFYTFYKYTHTNEDGEAVYAVAYVPAVEISGLEAYFAERTESHDHTSTVKSE